MKTLKLFFLATIIFASYTLFAQVAVNTDGTSADGSAMLEVKSTDKGFLPPRMTNAEIKSISNPTEGLMVHSNEENKPFYYDGTEWKGFDGTSTLPLEIGEFYQGGVVFYLDGNGGGLVCAVSDQSTSTNWGCYVIEITGADGTTIGTGEQNTIDIEAGCTDPGIAADICANLSSNGYDDWFLPSKDEMNSMYQNKATIDSTAQANGGNNFTDNYYWNSSEDSNEKAWVQSFNNGNPYSEIKFYNYAVRAVRAF